MDENFSRQQRSFGRLHAGSALGSVVWKKSWPLHAERDLLAINAIIYAEVSVHFSTQEELDAGAITHGFSAVAVAIRCGLSGGKVFSRLSSPRWPEARRRLPDFYIGAHAATEKLALLTRDVSRYRTYYPSVQLIIPG